MENQNNREYGIAYCDRHGRHNCNDLRVDNHRMAVTICKVRNFMQKYDGRTGLYVVVEFRE